MEKIRKHNFLYSKGLKSFYLGDNEYADMTIGEFRKAMNGYKPNTRRRTRNVFRAQNNLTVPGSVNWVEEGYVTEVKNQGECGSCWSFSATGALEGAHFRATYDLVSLSEENLLDCSSKYGNAGCEGGVTDYAFDYVIANKGIDSEASYPYKSGKDSCHFKKSNVAATISSYVDIDQGSEKALLQAAAKVGPIASAIDASHDSLQLYAGGVYDEAACTTTVDHAILVVGYGVDQGKDYWLVKNSWGASWGLKGYVKMSRNKNNQCGIANEASYPIV